MMGLQDYLQSSRLSLGHLDDYKTVHVVLGNESCDLDSAVSAIVYAYFLHQIHNDQDVVYLPVLNIPASDYPLRTEVVYALGLYNISQDDVIFRNQIDLPALKRTDVLKITLVDFNVFRGTDTQLEESVVEVLDHRSRERPEKEGVDVVIETVGSCCTLVAEKILKNSNHEEFMSKDELWLLYGTIVMDTVCLSESAGRTTAKDRLIIDNLEQKLPKHDRKAVFDKLQTAKFDVTGLSSVDLLRKDLKSVKNSQVTIAMSSIPMDMKDFLSKDDLVPSLDLFSIQQRAAALIIMTLTVDHQGEPHRQLAMYSKTPAILAKVTEALQDAKEPTLLLGELLPSPSPQICAYPQGNVKASRKLVAPLISDILQVMESDPEANQTNTPTSSPPHPLSGTPGNEDVKPSVTTPEASQSGSQKPQQTVEEDTGSDTNTSQLLYEQSKQTSDSNQNQLLDTLVDTTVSQLENKSTFVEDSDDNQSGDPFQNETNIILENTPENTASVTPASGLSSRSQSPTNGQTMNLGSSNFLLPGGGGAGSLGIPPVLITPVTPINSPTDSPTDSSVTSPQKQVDLPSFHSYEMVQKIKEKKASVGGSDEVSDETDTFPYTPSNSLAETGHLEQIPEHNLPSFLNQDMVLRINEKKAMLDGLLEGEGDAEGEEDVFPYTPKNSFTDSFDPSRTDVEVNLPSFNSAEMVQKIKGKKASIGFADGTENEMDHENDAGQGFGLKDEDIISEDEKLSFTPPNSFVNPSLISSCHGTLVEKELIDKINSLVQEEEISVQSEMDDTLISPTANTGNVVAYQIAQDMLEEHSKVMNSDVGDQDNSSEKDIIIVTGDSQEHVAQMITESVIQKATEIHRNSLKHLKNETTPDPTQKELTPSPPMIVIEDMSTESVISEPDDQLAMEGVAIYSSSPPDTENHRDSSFGAVEDSDVSVSDDSGIKMRDSDIVKVAEGEREDVKVAMDAQDAIDIQENRTDNDAKSTGTGMLRLGSEVGESHTEETDDDYQTVALETDDGAVDTMQSQINDGILHLGADPGESHTDTTDMQHQPQPLKTDPQPNITPEGMVDLGTAPGESSTDMSERNGDWADLETATETAREIVSTAIRNAVEVCRQQPDGSTAESKDSCDRQPPDGSSSTNKPTEGATDDEVSKKKDDAKLTKQQRSHLEGVRKALDIDLDLSSEDEEEIKNLKDQIPEELTSPRFNFLPQEDKVERPNSLDSTTNKKKILPNLDLLNDNDIDIPMSPISTDDDIGLSIEGEKTPDDLTTPDVLNNSMFAGELDWGSGTSSTPVEPIPEYTAREEFEDARHWKSVQIGDRWYKIDMKVIEPYKKVLSHGGYYGDGFNAIVVFTACYLPDRRRRDYHYVMDNLFLYVISTLELLVVEDYMIVYFHGATPRNKMPSLRWLKRCYDMIDRRLRKNLKGLLVVHPTIWLKTLVFMTKPFVSAKFSSKLRYIKNLDELTKAVPTEYIFVPEEVKQYDARGNKSPSVQSPT